MIAPLIVAGGYWLGKWKNRNFRRHWRWRLGRKLQLIVGRNKMKGYAAPMGRR